MSTLLDVIETAISAVKIIIPKSFGDARGSFSETYNSARFADCGMNLNFIQDNQSWSSQVGTLRGLHFQSAPKAQDKLIRVLRGRIYDVAVDLRRASPTYGKWIGEELSAENKKQLLVPIGFAHGFCTLEPDTEVLYKVTEYYSQPNDLGVAWDDPDLAINWPLSSDAVLSDKDKKQPAFRDLAAYF